MYVLCNSKTRFTDLQKLCRWEWTNKTLLQPINSERLTTKRLKTLASLATLRLKLTYNSTLYSQKESVLKNKTTSTFLNLISTQKYFLIFRLTQWCCDTKCLSLCVCVCVLTLPWELLGQLAQAAEAVGSQLAQDAWQHLRQLLGLSVARDGEGVGGQRRLHFRVVEVDHGPIVFYHIHLRGKRHSWNFNNSLESKLGHNMNEWDKRNSVYEACVYNLKFYLVFVLWFIWNTLWELVGSKL